MIKCIDESLIRYMRFSCQTRIQISDSIDYDFYYYYIMTNIFRDYQLRIITFIMHYMKVYINRSFLNVFFKNPEIVFSTYGVDRLQNLRLWLFYQISIFGFYWFILHQYLVKNKMICVQELSVYCVLMMFFWKYHLQPKRSILLENKSNNLL